MAENGSNDSHGGNSQAVDPTMLTVPLDTVRRAVNGALYPIPGWTQAEARKEAFQRACLRVLEKRLTLRLRDPTKYQAWVRVVARNATRSFCREVLREARRRMPDRLSPLEAGDDAEFEDELDVRCPIDRLDPVAEDYEHNETLREMLGEIVTTARQSRRRMWRLPYQIAEYLLKGYSEQEIAQQLGVNVKAIQNAKARTFKKAFAKYQELVGQRKRRGPVPGARGSQPERTRRARAPTSPGDDEDSVGDQLMEAATRVAASTACGDDAAPAREMLT